MYRQSPRAYPESSTTFTDAEVASLLSELANTSDRAAFSGLLSRFDAQFLIKYKTKFPLSPGKFPFGSTGKPYSYQLYAQAPYPFLNSGPTAPASAPQTQRPYTAREDDRAYQTPYNTGFGSSGMPFAGTGMSFGGYSQPPDYRVTTPPPQRLREMPYSAPIYDRGLERGYERPLGHTGPKPAYGSLADFADLRKSKEDQLYRFQGQQRPPNV
jgi:hypothetical protein